MNRFMINNTPDAASPGRVPLGAASALLDLVPTTSALGSSPSSGPVRAENASVTFVQVPRLRDRGIDRGASSPTRIPKPSPPGPVSKDIPNAKQNSIAEPSSGTVDELNTSTRNLGGRAFGNDLDVDMVNAASFTTTRCLNAHFESFRTILSKMAVASKRSCPLER